MPLSKAKDRERKKRVGIQPNDVVLHLNPDLKDWLIERASPRTPEQYLIEQLEKASNKSSRLESNLTPRVNGSQNNVPQVGIQPNEPPLYDPLKHMSGDTVTFVDRRGNKRVGIV